MHKVNILRKKRITTLLLLYLVLKMDLEEMESLQSYMLESYD